MSPSDEHRAPDSEDASIVTQQLPLFAKDFRLM
jgi:hypothetical protein